MAQLGREPQVAVFAEHHVDQGAITIDRAIQVLPLTVHPNTKVLAGQENIAPQTATPGIGLELVVDIKRHFPMKPRPIRMRPHVDGSVVDM